MSFDAMRIVMAAKGLPSSAKLVLIALANRMNGKTGACFPAYRTLAIDTGLSQRSCIRAVKYLIEADLLTIPAKGGGRISNHYGISGIDKQPVDCDNLSQVLCQNVTPDVTICHSSYDTVSQEPVIEPVNITRNVTPKEGVAFSDSKLDSEEKLETYQMSEREVNTAFKAARTAEIAMKVADRAQKARLDNWLRDRRRNRDCEPLVADEDPPWMTKPRNEYTAIEWAAAVKANGQKLLSTNESITERGYMPARRSSRHYTREELGLRAVVDST